MKIITNGLVKWKITKLLFDPNRIFFTYIIALTGYKIVLGTDSLKAQGIFCERMAVGRWHSESTENSLIAKNRLTINPDLSLISVKRR